MPRCNQSLRPPKGDWMNCREREPKNVNGTPNRTNDLASNPSIQFFQRLETEPILRVRFQGFLMNHVTQVAYFYGFRVKRRLKSIGTRITVCSRNLIAFPIVECVHAPFGILGVIGIAGLVRFASRRDSELAIFASLGNS